METYWCNLKNSIVSWIKWGMDFNPALIPCIKSEYERWKDCRCIHIRKAVWTCTEARKDNVYIS